MGNCIELLVDSLYLQKGLHIKLCRKLNSLLIYIISLPTNLTGEDFFTLKHYNDY